MNKLLCFLLGVGVGLVPVWDRVRVDTVKVDTWLAAHKQRDREDEKVRQSMNKILNRIELMGCPRSLPAKKK